MDYQVDWAVFTIAYLNFRVWVDKLFSCTLFGFVFWFLVLVDRFLHIHGFFLVSHIRSLIIFRQRLFTSAQLRCVWFLLPDFFPVFISFSDRLFPIAYLVVSIWYLDFESFACCNSFVNPSMPQFRSLKLFQIEYRFLVLLHNLLGLLYNSLLYGLICHSWFLRDASSEIRLLVRQSLNLGFAMAGLIRLIFV